MPGLDDAFASLTGVLAFRNANTKIGPRSAADVVLGPPHLAAIGPNSFTREGDSKPTFPTRDDGEAVRPGPERRRRNAVSSPPATTRI